MREGWAAASCFLESDHVPFFSPFAGGKNRRMGLGTCKRWATERGWCCCLGESTGSRKVLTRPQCVRLQSGVGMTGLEKEGSGI